MNTKLSPDIQKFIHEQIKEGRFTSEDALVEEAVRQLMLQSEIEIDDEAVDAINRAEDQLARGQGRDFHAFAKDMRQRISPR